MKLCLYRKMNGSGDHHFEREESKSKGLTLHVLSHLWNYRPKMIIFIIPKMEREYEREIV
jgi:hypothetical protein